MNFKLENKTIYSKKAYHRKETKDFRTTLNIGKISMINHCFLP
jgi:hypothetical protein